MRSPIARIDYLNTEPFFHGWREDLFPVLRGAPRALAHAAREGRVSAGPLPTVACWDLEPDFTPLGSFGIAGGQKVGSVFLVSHLPLSQLNNVTIGVTEETSTSVVLCATLIGQKYNHRVRFLRGQRPDDAGFVVIGDAALRLAHDPSHSGWSSLADLAAEWWEWQELPFVFAQWVARRDMAADEREALRSYVDQNLTEGLNNLERIAEIAAHRAGLTGAQAYDYLSGIGYRLGDGEHESIRRFKELAPSSASMLGALAKGATKEAAWSETCPV